MYRLLVLVLFVGLAAAQMSALHAAERVALVIGNGNYEHATELPNPRNDAEEMAATLSSLGFQVIKGIDLDRSGMEGKIREFARAVRQAKLALFFYAGHGMQVNGRNFLIPVDAELADSTALDFEAVDADQVFRYMGSAERVALAFLDACRNNPLARRFARTLGPTRSAAVGDGLAAPSTTGTGLFIAFATAPNDVALDGDGRNSPFTQALLKHLPSPGLEIQQVMTRVKADVWQATAGDQQPWHSSDLRLEVYLLPTQSADPQQDDPLAVPFDERAVELAFWEAIKDSPSPAAFEAYLTRYPQGTFAPLAQLRLAALDVMPDVEVPVGPPVAAERLARSLPVVQRGHSGSVTLEISPDGRTIISGSYDSTLKLWDLDTGRLLRTFSGRSGIGIRSVAISPDGGTIASGNGSYELDLWDFQTGRLLRTLTGHSETVQSIASLPTDVRSPQGAGTILSNYGTLRAASFCAPCQVIRTVSGR